MQGYQGKHQYGLFVTSALRTCGLFKFSAVVHIMYSQCASFEWILVKWGLQIIDCSTTSKVRNSSIEKLDAVEGVVNIQG